MNAEIIRQGIRNAELEGLKARARTRVIDNVAQSVENILNIWLDPREGAELLAGMLSMRAIASEITIEQVQALTRELYEANSQRLSPKTPRSSIVLKP